jgi:hypothetical protein
MQIIRGTTPIITANVKSNINLANVTQAWAYIYQQGEIVVDKTASQVVIDAQAKTIRIALTQAETLSLRADVGALFQIRLKLSSGAAFASLAANIAVKEVYKGGVI